MSSVMDHWVCHQCNGRGIVSIGQHAMTIRETVCGVCDGSGQIKTEGEAMMATHEAKEAVMHPQHYNAGRFEVIDVIEDWQLGFNDGNAVKYIGRHRHKASPKEDLKKAFWYLARELMVTHAASAEELTVIIQTIRK